MFFCCWIGLCTAGASADAGRSDLLNRGRGSAQQKSLPGENHFQGKQGGARENQGLASQGWRPAGWAAGPLRVRLLGKSTGGRPWGLVLGTYLTWKSVPGGLDHIRGNPGSHFQGLGEGGSNHSFFIRNLGLIGTKPTLDFGSGTSRESGSSSPR